MKKKANQKVNRNYKHMINTILTALDMQAIQTENNLICVATHRFSILEYAKVLLENPGMYYALKAKMATV